MTERLTKTVFRLIWGGTTVPEETRYFSVTQLNDAVRRFGEKVSLLNNNKNNTSAYVNLAHMADQIFTDDVTLIAWTKTDPDYVVSEGVKDYQELLQDPEELPNEE